MKLKRIIQFIPAFDKTPRNPGEPNYGIHGVDIKFILKNKNGAVQFLLYTNWQLPHLRKRWDEKVEATLLNPIPADLGYHSPTRKRWAAKMAKCDLYENGCYYDGSGLNAYPIFDLLVEKGEQAVWEALEKYHIKTFGKSK